MALTAETLTTEQFAVPVQGALKGMVEFVTAVKMSVKTTPAMTVFSALKLMTRPSINALSAHLDSLVTMASTAWISMNASQ